jgi:hypothetical protein
MSKSFSRFIFLSMAGVLLTLSSQVCLAGESALTDNQLREGDAMITGKLSLTILAGTEWVLTHFNRNEPIQEDAEVTLAFAPI